MTAQRSPVEFIDFETELAQQGVQLHPMIGTYARIEAQNVTPFCFTPSGMLRAVKAAGDLVRSDIPGVLNRDARPTVPAFWRQDVVASTLTSLLLPESIDDVDKALAAASYPLAMSRSLIVPTTCQAAEYHLMRVLSRLGEGRLHPRSPSPALVRASGQTTMIVNEALGLTVHPIMNGPHLLPPGSWVSVSPGFDHKNSLVVVDDPDLDLSFIRLSTLVLNRKDREIAYSSLQGGGTVLRKVLGLQLGTIREQIDKMAAKHAK